MKREREKTREAIKHALLHPHKSDELIGRYDKTDGEAKQKHRNAAAETHK